MGESREEVDGMSEANERLPFDMGMCMEQFAATIGFVDMMQGSSRTEDACDEAERRCAELFDGFYSSEDRMRYLVMLGYLAMDIAANVDYTLTRVEIERMTR